jgi:hypothetical protein
MNKIREVVLIFAATTLMACGSQPRPEQVESVEEKVWSPGMYMAQPAAHPIGAWQTDHTQMHVLFTRPSIGFNSIYWMSLDYTNGMWSTAQALSLDSIEPPSLTTSTART